MTTTPEDIIQAALWQGRYMGISNCREAAADILEALHEAGYAILASSLLDRIKREAAAEALEEFANEYQETRIRVSIASPNVGDYWAGAHDATGHAVDSLRSTAELLRKGHE